VKIHSASDNQMIWYLQFNSNIHLKWLNYTRVQAWWVLTVV